MSFSISNSDYFLKYNSVFLRLQNWFIYLEGKKINEVIPGQAISIQRQLSKCDTYLSLLQVVIFTFVGIMTLDLIYYSTNCIAKLNYWDRYSIWPHLFEILLFHWSKQGKSLDLFFKLCMRNYSTINFTSYNYWDYVLATVLSTLKTYFLILLKQSCKPCFGPLMSILKFKSGPLWWWLATPR